MNAFCKVAALSKVSDNIVTVCCDLPQYYWFSTEEFCPKTVLGGHGLCTAIPRPLCLLIVDAMLKMSVPPTLWCQLLFFVSAGTQPPQRWPVCGGVQQRLHSLHFPPAQRRGFFCTRGCHGDGEQEGTVDATGPRLLFPHSSPTENSTVRVQQCHVLHHPTYSYQSLLDNEHHMYVCVHELMPSTALFAYQSLFKSDHPLDLCSNHLTAAML